MIRLAAGTAAAFATASVVFWWIAVNTLNAIQPWNDHLPLPDVADWQLHLYDSMSGQSLIVGSVVAGVIVGACLVLLILRLLQSSESQAKAAQLYTFSMLNLFFVAVSFVALVILVETQKIILRGSQQLTYISALPYTFLFLSSLVVLILLHLKSDNISSLQKESGE